MPRQPDRMRRRAWIVSAAGVAAYGVVPAAVAAPPAGTVTDAATILGPGPETVVFIHTVAGSRADWRAQAHALADRYQVIALDLIGHGRRAAEAKDGVTIRAMTDDVVSTLDRLGVRKAYFVGNLAGATIIYDLAARMPDRVAGVVTVNSTGDIPAGPLASRESAYRDLDADLPKLWRGMLTASKPATRQTVLRGVRQTSPVVIRSFFHEFLFTFDPKPGLRAVADRMVSIHGPQPDDPTAPHRLERGIGSLVIDTESAWPQLDQPALCTALIRAALRGLDRGAR